MDETVRVVRAFNDALNAQDVEAMMRLLTDDCVFENTYPPPDGARYVGQAAVRAFWEEFFRGAQQPTIEIQDLFACENRCAAQWTYRWQDADGSPAHICGADVYEMRDGKIAVKSSYVKG